MFFLGLLLSRIVQAYDPIQHTSLLPPDSTFEFNSIALFLDLLTILDHQMTLLSLQMIELLLHKIMIQESSYLFITIDLKEMIINKISEYYDCSIEDISIQAMKIESLLSQLCDD